jgi:hypothetical protein
MSAIDHLKPRLISLTAEHRALETQIRSESRRSAPDFARVASMKKRKLALKDAIALLSRRAGGHGGTAHG